MTSIELIDQIRSGQNVRAAEEALYRIVQEALVGRLEKRIPAYLRSRLDAEDTLHAAFLRAMAALSRFQPKNEHAFTAWVYQIAKNLISDAGERRSAAAVRFADRNATLGGPRVSQVLDKVTGHTASYARRELVESLLARLAPKEAEVIRLHDLQGRSYDEIAAAWQSTPAAVQRFHSRVCEKLRKLAPGPGE
jgi:RNA polymerase sigma factor (sigma-70 family)